MRGEQSFRFIGIEYEIAKAEDWNNHKLPKLWLYNVHYFHDLVADDAGDRVDSHRNLIERWIVENPPGVGNGWEPYTVSLRIVNWIKWILTGNKPSENMLFSLAVQARWLSKRLEIHLLGNHLWANSKALVFAGIFYEGPESDKWREKGWSLVRREISEQILDDGGHYERSPMYHSIVLEDLLDLIQLGELSGKTAESNDIDSWKSLSRKMLHWLRVMTHPDGGPSFFNDTELGTAPAYADLIKYAAGLGIDTKAGPLAAIEALPDSGYFRLEIGEAVVIADAAEIGPFYIPGHGHADTLSFELSLYGKRVLVNGGISTYEDNRERHLQRGTSMHNTMEVNNLDSSEVWSSFRVGRRARPLNIDWEIDAGDLVLEASHDGYAHLTDVGLVSREWRLSASKLVVTDSVQGHPDRVVSRFRTHPSLEQRLLGESCGIYSNEDIEVKWTAKVPNYSQVVDGSWHPYFGSNKKCKVLELTLKEGSLRTEFNWA